MATQPEEIEDRAADSDKLGDVFDRALRRFDQTVCPQLEMRALALAARRFVSIPGAMWEGEWGEQFDNTIRVEVNKVAAGVEKIVRDYRDNRIVPDFRPAGPDANSETADTLDGMHRADSYHFKAQQARDNAFEEAAMGGFGAYRLSNQLADPYDKDSDYQRINPGITIVDADQRVFFDGNSKLYDKSDARFAFVLTACTRDAFVETWGDDKATSWPEGIPKIHYDFFTPDTVIQCEYYEVEDKTERLLIFSHRLTGEEERHWGSDLDADDIAEMVARGWAKTERRQKRRRIHKYTMSGAEVLKDNGFIAGSCIPIVPVYGKRWFIDDQERFQGYVQLKMDANRLYNSNLSKLAELNSLSPREKPIFLAEQMPPHLADQWAEQEIKRHPYAVVDPVIDNEGNYVATGPIGKIEPPRIPEALAALLQIARIDLTEDQQDADEVVANTSAEAMDMAATRIDAKSGIYLDNMRQSVQREGEIYLSMCPAVNHEPGRTVETMSEDGEDGEAVIAEPYTDRDGRHFIRNDFSRGKYKVIADVTEATATRRDKAVKASLGIAEAATKVGDQELGTIGLLMAVMNQDGEGTSEFQAYARKRLVEMGVVEPNEEEARQMEEAAENAQPDPAQQVLAAQAAALAAQAQKDQAQAGESQSKIALNEAKVVETLADAGKKREEARRPANDIAMGRMKIMMGRDVAA
ncbi:MAG TPA: portal protein [Sphingomicrobium sp.]|nr:portal protein [Sphingomicrobium sp.]